LDNALAGKAAAIHQHSQNDIQGLTDTLAGMQDQINQRALTTHTHTTGDITGLEGYIQQVVTDMGGAGGGDVAVGALQW
jgi:flagellar hook-basal body complex protein FliE